MSIGKSHFVGAAGQYFVAYGLSVREVCASITVGNAPGVDLFVSHDGGLNSLAIQVKTSRNAYRSNHYGNEGYEWDVGVNVIDKQSTSFWYAFVDLQENQGSWNPQVFFVPSKWVAEFVKPDWTRHMYFLPTKAVDLCLNRWDLIPKMLDNDKTTIEFATTWPEDKLIRWGV